MLTDWDSARQGKIQDRNASVGTGQWAVLFSWFIGSGTFNERNNKLVGLNLSYMVALDICRIRWFVSSYYLAGLVKAIKRPKSPRPGHFSLHHGNSTRRRSWSRRCTAACSTSSTPGSRF